MKIVTCHTADSKPVKQEVNSTMILPPLVFLTGYAHPLRQSERERERELQARASMHAQAESGFALSVPHSVSQSACVIILTALLFLNGHSMTLSAMAFGKMTLSIRCFYSITMLCKYAECHVFCYAECHYAECRYAECRGALLKPQIAKQTLICRFHNITLTRWQC